MLLFATMENSNAFISLFENNLFNWVLLVVFVGWLCAKYAPAAFASRASGIQTALEDAGRARAEGEAFLQAQKQKIANAEKEMDNILAEAVQVANQMRQQMEKQTAKEMADLQARMEQEMSNERQLAISQLRSAAAKAAVILTEAALPAAITDGTRKRLLEQFVDQLEVAQ
jgi:F0F1-type ATP synthase membrane subunit b/b'